MIERHQDYLLTVATVPVGGIAQVPLQLDTDAPFALRLVRSRNIENGSNTYNGWRFTNPKTAYQSSGLRTDWILATTSGGAAQPSRGSIVYEEMVYPPGATIQVDIGNNTGEPITNAQLLFRGSKLFKDGSLWVPSYPERMAILPAIYQVVVPAVPVSGQILNNLLSIKHDADMVIRCGVCDAFTLTSGAPEQDFEFQNVYVQLRDEQYKAYSNAPIHVNDLFGQGLPATGQDDDVLFTPGLFTPEIYVPRRHNLYFDVIRADESVEGSVPVDLYFRFIGMKVFQR